MRSSAATLPGQKREFSDSLRPVLRCDMRAPAGPYREIRELPLTEGQLHALCPAGIGDFFWIWQKWEGVARVRKVTFHFPMHEQNRAGELVGLLGGRAAYMTNLLTNWVWSQPGDPPIPPPGEAGVLVVHANRHLEAGRALTDWYPDLPRCRPDIERRYPRWEPVYPYVLAFLCHRNYMQGNLEAWQWGRVLNEIHAEIAPVKIIARERDLEFAAHVMQHYHSGEMHVFNESLSGVLAQASGALCMIGVAGGPTIVGSLLCPSLIGYPDWLAHAMPGKWELPGQITSSCALRELYERVMGGELQRLIALENGGRPA